MRLETCSTRTLDLGQDSGCPYNRVYVPLLQNQYTRRITVEGDRNDCQTVGNNRCWGGGISRQEVEYKAEDPTGYLFILCPLIFFPGGVNHMPREWDEFLVGCAVVGPPDGVRPPISIDQRMDVDHCVTEWKAPEIGVGLEDSPVASANICCDTRIWACC